MGSKSLFVKCSTCGADIAKSAKTCPHCGGKQKKRPVIRIIAVIFLVLSIAAAILPSEKTKKTQTQTKDSKTTVFLTDSKQPSISTNNSSEKVAKETSEDKHITPADQNMFIELITTSMKDFLNAKNEVQESMARDKRKVALQNSSINRSIQSWIGKIDRLSTNSEGKAILYVKINQDISLATMNNSFSDSNYNTLIDKSSNMYLTLSDLSVGDVIEFSGSFFPSKQDHFHETSLTIQGSMKQPEFLFKFHTINKNS